MPVSEGSILACRHEKQTYLKSAKPLLNAPTTAMRTHTCSLLTLSLQPLLSSYFVSMWMENLGRNEHCG